MKQYVLGKFHDEFVGNLKPGVPGLTINELTELTELYPEIWGEYVRKFNEHSTQSNQQSLPFRMGSDLGQQNETGAKHENEEIVPTGLWYISNPGFDTP